LARKRILYIEDDPSSRLLVRKILERDGYHVYDAHNGTEGIDKAITIRPDLILMDIGMPGMDGYETTTRMKGSADLKDLPIVALTGRTSEGDRERCLIAGCSGYLTKPIIVREFSKRIEDYLKGARETLDPLEGSRYFSEYSQRLANRLDEMNRQLLEYDEQMNSVCSNVMSSMMNALEQKDPYTFGHSTRVTRFALTIGRHMKLAAEELATLARAGVLHDVGKMVIDLSEINKSGSLTKKEWARMKKHPTIGASILAPLCFLHKEIRVVARHHERWDGQGYPDGVSGSKLDIPTCIITAADSYDAMTSARSYRNNILKTDEVIDEFKRCRGRQFHPDVADKVITLIEQEKLQHQTGVGRMLPITGVA
jgi:putative nucleotidyltransferase with HDIG domain